MLLSYTSLLYLHDLEIAICEEVVNELNVKTLFGPGKNDGNKCCSSYTWLESGFPFPR
jgi:hypothetical protein